MKKLVLDFRFRRCVPIITLLLFVSIIAMSMSSNSLENHMMIQETEAVEIIKEIQGKRIKFYALNHTQETYELFFMIESQGFRRSADRPLIKQIPANKRVYLMTIIPIRGQDTSYTIIKNYEREELRDIEFEKTDSLVNELRQVQPDSIP